MFFEKNIFISHSSNNKEIAEQLCAFFTAIGINNDRIFCSSVIGQGVNNGEKLNDAIVKAINKSKILVYIISRDFINSSYCMEELGAGWFLAQNKKASCFFLKLPDVELSELSGFVNSKIDKFSFVDENHKDELGLFAENIFGVLHRKLPKHSYLINAENTFFSSTKVAFEQMIKRQKEIQLANEKRDNEIKLLNEKIKNQINEIKSLENIIEEKKDSRIYDNLSLEFNTIRKNFFLLGTDCGITNNQFNSLYKNFWFRMVNRYLELEEKLGYREGYDANMEMLFATIFSANGDEEEAYEHLKKYVNLYEHNIYPDFYRNIKISEDNDMNELIEILKIKIAKEKKGVVQDSYKETLEHLENRKNLIESKLQS